MIRNVLVLCTGNSARSILGEALINARGEGRYRAYSAGSAPVGKVNPFAIETLKSHGLSTDGLRSKSWDEFAPENSPSIDIVLTVCDSAAAEACPIWPGHPITAHWGIPDPARVDGTDEQKRAAFRTSYETMERRVKTMVALPMDRMNDSELRTALKTIGTS